MGNIDTQNGRRRVLLTTDCGADMDDQWALALLALCPEAELCGVVTTHAPNMESPEATARCAREVLERIPGIYVPLPPIIPGSSEPLADKITPHPNAGVDFIIKTAAGHDAQNRLTVLTIGAATDVGSALLVDPTLAERIEIVAMGFLNWPEGGVEFNIQNDPKAWQVMLESTAPIVVGDQAVCRKDLLVTPARAHEMFDPAGEPGRFLADMLESWIARDPAGLAGFIGQPNIWPIWDCVTIAHLLGLATVETHPRPTLNDELRFEHPADPTVVNRTASGRTIDWITSVDSARLWGLFAERLKQAR